MWMLGLKKTTKQKKSHENTHKTTYLCNLNYGLIAKLISFAELKTELKTYQGFHTVLSNQAVIFRLTG